MAAQVRPSIAAEVSNFKLNLQVAALSCVNHGIRCTLLLMRIVMLSVVIVAVCLLCSYYYAQFVIISLLCEAGAGDCFAGHSSATT